MKISIFGMGYVGSVSGACLASEGHTIIGVDSNPTKAEIINSGNSPIIEKDLDTLIEACVGKKLLSATCDAHYAIQNTDVSFICVGTPSQANGNLDLTYVQNACKDIGRAIASKKGYHVIVARSTMLPGSMSEVVIPALEASSGLKAGKDFGVCNNPEFLREGTSVYDFYNPPKTVIGETDQRSGDVLVELYKSLDAPLIRTSIEVAEMVKYTDNVWHALKISFANEIGNVCKAVGIDSHRVMDIFCQDTKLNLSPYYMKPGFAFGGSCLPKDVRALNYKAKSLDIELPIIGNIMHNNRLQVERGFEMIVGKQNRKISVLGFSFKAGTDDLRESPIVDVIERLIGKGYDVKLYDENVNLARLTGANKDYILNVIPHISQLMVGSLDEALAHAETIVIGNSSAEFKDIMQRTSDAQVVVDLVRIGKEAESGSGYEGICW